MRSHILLNLADTFVQQMFECGACTLRAIRAIAGESSLVRPHPHPRLLLTPCLSHQAPRRANSSLVATVSNSSDGERYLNAAQIRHHKTKDNDEGPDAVSASERCAIQKELRWLQDPLKFAEHVHYTLRCAKPAKALELCRAASRQLSCVVAWNHVVNWYMQNGRINDAMNVYNEMKKRAQFPDSYTYMLLLRGFVGQQNHHRKEEIKEEHAARAVCIYNSMSSPTSRVKPTIMHTNAVLKVCSFAFDLDALWGVVGTIPESGPGSADVITYTIILQAIRHGTVSKRPDMTVDQVETKGLQAVDEGMKVWQEVVQKWRSGAVQIDEELVCAMARIMFLSDRLQRWDDVLSLVQQTMQIERLVPRMGSEDRHTGHVPQPEALPELSPSEQEDHEGYVATPAGKIFNEVQPLPAEKATPKRPAVFAYAKPGNDTLSVLVEACTRMRVPKVAKAYWDLLTKSYGVKPDANNFHSLLALLRINRSSHRAAQLLKEDMPAAGAKPHPMSFNMAMAVCARDNKNPNVLEHARTIIDVMESTVTEPDVKALTQYVSLALATDDGPKIAATLDRLDSFVHNLRSIVSYGSSYEVDRLTSPEVRHKRKEMAMQLFAIMIGAIDTLMNRGMVPREDFEHWHGRRSQLHRFLGRSQGRLAGTRERLNARGPPQRPSRDMTPTIPSSRSQRPERSREEHTMNKGSWELMMFRKRNSRRRSEANDEAWGAQTRRNDGSEPRAVRSDGRAKAAWKNGQEPSFVTRHLELQ